MLVDLFFALNLIVTSSFVEIPGRHSKVTKSLEKFTATLVRVRNFCQHELAEEQTKKRVLKSEKITGEFQLCIFISPIDSDLT